MTRIVSEKNRRITKGRERERAVIVLISAFCTYYDSILRATCSFLLFPGSFTVKSRLVAHRKYSWPSPPPRHCYLRQCSSTLLPLCYPAFSPDAFNMFSCTYARKFKYLLFVIKFGRANGMEILHGDCAMQRDRPRLFVRGNDDLHIDRYCILLLPHFATRAISL